MLCHCMATRTSMLKRLSHLQLRLLREPLIFSQGTCEDVASFAGKTGIAHALSWRTVARHVHQPSAMQHSVESSPLGESSLDASVQKKGCGSGQTMSPRANTLDHAIQSTKFRDLWPITPNDVADSLSPSTFGGRRQWRQPLNNS